MATLSIDVPNGDLLTTLIAAAVELGYPATQAGAKAMVVDFLKERYRTQKRLAAQRSVATTIDAAVTAARTAADGIT